MVLKKYLSIITILFAFVGFFSCSLSSLVPINYVQACGGDDTDGDGDICDHSDGENMFNCPGDCLPVGVPDKLIPDVIDDMISWFLKFAIAISVLALVYGGTCYVFSSGDMQKTENAKKIVKYALIGIFITGVSFAIVTIIDTVFH